jgi:dienelactone hydrolase
MKANIFIKGALFCVAMMAISFNSQSKSPTSAIKEELVSYMAGDVSLQGFVAYDESIKGKRPVVLVVHEWWGLNDYLKMRARKLAELGYLAIAVDMFGNGKVAANPKEAQELTGPFYNDPQLAKSRLDAAINEIKGFPQADPNNIAAIGYCFGGSVVLNSAKLGADLKGVVSFHGGLAGGAPFDKKLLKAKLLICQGGADKFVSMKDADTFKHKLDSIGATYTFKVYPNATHAFTNPDATKIGKEFNMPIEYNVEGDKNSWNDMKVFLASLFNKK